MDDLLPVILTSRVCDIARQTPLGIVERLSERIHNMGLLKKRKNLQPIFSVRLREACNRIACLSDDEAETLHIRQRVDGRV